MNTFFNRNDDKCDIYKNEIPYRMVKNIAKIYWPCNYEKELNKYGLMIIKPEALLTGKTSKIFSILQSAGYKIIFYIKKRIDPLCTSETWRFSWENSSLEHILINQKLFSLCESLILILSTDNLNEISVCEMLTALKGSSNEFERKPYQIRQILDPINYVLNYVHSSDDVNDFLRELGILLDLEELIQAFEAMFLNNNIPYPNIEESIISTHYFTFDNWLNKIFGKLNHTDISSFDKQYIIEKIEILKNDSKEKITFDFLYRLARNDLIEWNFETLIVLSSNIDFSKE